MDNKGKVVSDLELRYIDVDTLKISSEALKLIPMDISRRYSILPFKIAQDKLQLISAEDLNAYTIEELKFISKKKIEAFKGDKEKVLNLIYKNYEVKEAQETVYKLNEAEENKNQLIKKENLNSPIIKILNYIITEAILKKSSDIHLEPNNHNVTIRFRIDGVLYRVQEIPKNIFNQITIRIKILSNLDITEKRIPQDGKFEYKANSKTYDIRVSSMPTIYGEKLALRILYKDSENISLSKLGFDNKGIQLIKSFLNIPYGMILVTGPTGSGKTTTLYSMINEIDKEHKNIITIEDPVEYYVKDINQINVNNKTGLTFATGLKSILRQDADMILVGEIRDEETAQIAVRAAITGHLVFSTLHTSDIASSVLRLLDMKVPPYLVSDALVGIISQRLVRKLCSHCKDMGNRGECPYCSGTGYSGRTVIYEAIKMDENHKKIIARNFSIDEFNKYNTSLHHIPLKENALSLVSLGVTSLNEVKKV